MVLFLKFFLPQIVRNGILFALRQSRLRLPCQESGGHRGIGLVIASGEVEYQLGWLYSYSWSIAAGPITWGDISGLIRGSWSNMGTLICHIPPGDRGLPWYQTAVKWGEAQQRYCEKFLGSSYTCYSWSQYYHLDAPAKFDTTSGKVHLGCSTGSASECH